MKKYNIVCVGLEHFIDKIGYQSSIYSERGDKIIYLVSDVSGGSNYFAKKYNAAIVRMPSSPFRRIIYYVRYILQSHCNEVELYLTGKLSILYSLIAKILCKRLIIILRGMEFNKSGFEKFVNVVSLRLANRIIAKEYNLVHNCKIMGFDHKTFFVHNCVPLPEASHVKSYSSRSIDILYLNTPRPSRNVIFLIEVIEKLLSIRPNLKILLCGFSILDDYHDPIEPEYQKKILKLIKERHLDKKVEIRGFVKNARELVNDSKVFVLPANIIFCNYTLLEAMSFGCVPVVSNGEGCDLIINNSKNGYISTLDADCMSSLILDALNPDEWEKFSIAARECIKYNFSMDKWYDLIQVAKC